MRNVAASTALAAVFLLACGNPDPKAPPANGGPSGEAPDSGIPDAGSEITIESVDVEPHPDWICINGCLNVLVNEERVLVAIVKDSTGAVRDDVQVIWSSSDEALATVDQEGVVTAKKVGLVEIRATAEGVTGAATLRVHPARVAKITVTPHPATVAAGAQVQLTATAEDDLGNVLDDVDFEWFSGNPNLATVDDDGLVTGVAGGTTVVVATSDRGFGSDGWATVEVTSSATTPRGFGMTAVALAAHHGCGVGADGVTYCWGWNYFGQMGVGRLDEATDSFPVPEVVLGEHEFVKVALGGYHSCALESDGKAWCWGVNDKGQLGTHLAIGLVGGTTEPFEVLGGHHFAQISATHAHTCGVATDGTGYCWGMGLDGSLGTGSLSDKPTPTKVSGERSWLEIVTGLMSSCGIDADGKAWCWGRNSMGQIGAGLPASEHTPNVTPVAVSGERTYVDIALDGTHVCALDPDGAAWCWGNNVFGQLGDGTTTDQNEPVAVDTPERFVQVAVAAHHSCARQQDGDVFCWGNNDSGQLGNGGLAGSLTPVKAMGGHAFAELDAAGNVSCGIRTDGATYCWGSAYTGETAAGFSGGMLVAPNPVVPPATTP